MTIISDDDMFSLYEKRIQKDQIVEKLQKISKVESLDCDSFDDWLKEPFPLELDEIGQLVVKISTEEGGNKDEIILDPFGVNSPELTYYIPPCPFETQHGGNLSKQQESEALFKVTLVNKVSDGIYNDEIKKIKLNYDWKSLKGSDGGMPFYDLLAKVQQSKNYVIGMFLSAINVKLSENVEKNETLFVGYVSSEEASALDDIKRRRRALEYDKSEEVKLKTDRMERFATINKWDRKIDKMLEEFSDEIQLLHRIGRLDANIVPFPKVVKMGRIADHVIATLVKVGRLDGEGSNRKKIRKNLIRRGKRQYLVEFKRKTYAKYADGQRSNLLPKA